MNADDFTVPDMPESLRRRPEVRVLLRVPSDPLAALGEMEQAPEMFNFWLAKTFLMGEGQAVQQLLAQSWHVMTQDPDHFHRWLAWWGDRWNDTVIRDQPVLSSCHDSLRCLMPMAVWCRPSPGLPEGQPWGEPAMRFWRRLADHGTGWFEQPAVGSQTSQVVGLDTLGFNPNTETVTSALGVAVVHGRAHAIAAWESLGATWDKPPRGVSSHVISPLLAALVRSDAAQHDVVHGLGASAKRWGLAWGHANNTREQNQGWKPVWLERTARGTLWDVAVQHPDEDVQRLALRGIMAMRPKAREDLILRSGLPPLTARGHLARAEGLALRDTWPTEVPSGPDAPTRSRTRL